MLSFIFQLIMFFEKQTLLSLQSKIADDIEIVYYRSFFFFFT